MPGINLIRALLEQSSAKGTKATLLNPLQWIMGILITGLAGTYYFELPAWVTVVFMIFIGAVFLLYIGTYIYCLIKNPDALRSETYSIQKMAIEKSFVGDNVVGPVNPTSIKKTPQSIAIAETMEDNGE